MRKGSLAPVVGSIAMVVALFSGVAWAQAGDYWICVSNEKGGDVSIIDGGTLKVVDTVSVGKRPRGVHPSPDGRTLYVALSGRPIEGPPQLDAKGNPVFKKGDDEDEEKNSDHAADGIGVVDLVTRKLVKKLPAGSDPEQFAVGPDGGHLWVSNEDVGTMSAVDVGSGKVAAIVPVGREPEGVEFTPDGKRVFVTCETNGDVFAVDASTFKVVGHFNVPPRPRNVAFSPDGVWAFVPSESSGQMSLVDAGEYKVVKTVQLPAGVRPMGMVVGAGGKRVYVSTGRGGSVLVLDAGSLSPVGRIAVGKRPWGLAISPDGGRVFVANGPTNDVSVIDTATEKEVARVKVGESPWGVTVVRVPGRGG